MQPEDIAAGYDQIADRWQSPSFNQDNGIAQHQRAFQFGVSRGAALDIGCGCSGRIITLLQDTGYAPEGLDLSVRTLELAKNRHPDTQFHHADICTWNPSKTYDFISAWDSIWHIPLDQQAPTLTKIINMLSPGGIFIFTFGGLDEPSSMTNKDMDVPMYYSTLGISGTLNVVQAAGAICRHMEFDQHPEPHVYVIAQAAL